MELRHIRPRLRTLEPVGQVLICIRVLDTLDMEPALGSGPNSSQARSIRFLDKRKFLGSQVDQVPQLVLRFRHIHLSPVGQALQAILCRLEDLENRRGLADQGVQACPKHQVHRVRLQKRAKIKDAN